MSIFGLFVYTIAYWGESKKKLEIKMRNMRKRNVLEGSKSITNLVSIDQRLQSAQ